jgi:DNA-binding NtrC family response regulator
LLLQLRLFATLLLLSAATRTRSGFNNPKPAHPGLAMPPLVLLVEEHEGVRRLLTAKLQSIGLEVRATRESELGLQIIAQSERSCAIVADPCGRTTDSKKLLEAIRSVRPIPAFFFTSYTEFMLDESLPAVQHFRKPYDLTGLCEAVCVSLRLHGPDEPIHRIAAR